MEDDAKVKADGESEEVKLSYDEKLKFVSPIAKPMASKKLAKKLFKLVKAASQQKDYLRTGLKDVFKRIRKGETGVVIFAGDVSPIEVMCHLPAVCESKNIPYVYVPSRKDLGHALGAKRACVMVLVRPHKKYEDLYNELHKIVEDTPLPI